jgi:hypothetical protein
MTASHVHSLWLCHIGLLVLVATLAASPVQGAALRQVTTFNIFATSRPRLVATMCAHVCVNRRRLSRLRCSVRHAHAAQMCTHDTLYWCHQLHAHTMSPCLISTAHAMHWKASVRSHWRQVRHLSGQLQARSDAHLISAQATGAAVLAQRTDGAGLCLYSRHAAARTTYACRGGGLEQRDPDLRCEPQLDSIPACSCLRRALLPDATPSAIPVPGRAA